MDVIANRGILRHKFGGIDGRVEEIVVKTFQHDAIDPLQLCCKLMQIHRADQDAVVGDALGKAGGARVFRRQFAELKRRTQQTIQRLKILERDRQAGLTEPSQDYFKIGGKTLEDLNREAAAKNGPADPLTTLEKGGKGTVRK